MNAFSICRWEWFKLLRRRLPWVLLAILFGFSQLSIWGGLARYASEAATGGRVFVPNVAASPDAEPGARRGARMVTCREVEENPAAALPAGTPPQNIDSLLRQCAAQRATLATRHQALTPVGSIASALGVCSVMGLILLGVLGATAVGSEFGLGTLRPILARGTGRLPFLAGKYLMLIGAATAAMLIVCATAAASGALAGQLAPPPPDGPLLAVAFSTVAVSFVKIWGGLLAYVTMAGAITLLVRSTAIGMAISLGWYILERVLARLLTSAFDWFEPVAEYLPMHNLSTLTSTNTDLLAVLTGGNNPDTLQASLVLAAWAIALAAIAAVVFRRRDVTGAAGG